MDSYVLKSCLKMADGINIWQVVAQLVCVVQKLFQLTAMYSIIKGFASHNCLSHVSSLPLLMKI